MLALPVHRQPSKWGQPQDKSHIQFGCSGYPPRNLKLVPLTDDYEAVTHQLSLKPASHTCTVTATLKHTYAPYYVSPTTTSVVNAGNLVINKPAVSGGVIANDVLIASIAFVGNPTITFTGSWTLTFWTRNLLNRNYYELLTAAPGNSGLYVGQPGDPRTIGVTMRLAIKTK